MTDASQRSNLADRFTFGSWWTTAPVLKTQLKGCSSAELEYVVRSAVGYQMLAKSLGSDAAESLVDELKSTVGHYIQSPTEFLGQVASGESVDWVSLHRRLAPLHEHATPVSRPSHRSWTPLTEEEVSNGLEQFIFAAATVSGDLEKFGQRLQDRWGLARPPVDAVRDVLSAIVEANGTCQPDTAVEVLMAPPALDAYLDQAMFIPLPPDLPIVLVITERYMRLAQTDPFASSRLLLAASHEVLGHGTQFGKLSFALDEVTHASLDREWLEGWGIQGETLLGGLGFDETALYYLYRCKRLLPLIRQATIDTSWAKHRAQIENAWQNFFHDPATNVLRRATGAHARGMIHVERYLKSNPGLTWQNSTTPWLVANTEPSYVEPR